MNKTTAIKFPIHNEQNTQKQISRDIKESPNLRLAHKKPFSQLFGKKYNINNNKKPIKLTTTNLIEFGISMISSLSYTKITEDDVQQFIHIDAPCDATQGTSRQT